MISGRYSSTTLAMASSDLESLLSPVYLHRHSRQTRSNDMEPLAKSTMFNADDEPRAGTTVGANAEAEATRRAAAKVFMVRMQVVSCSTGRATIRRTEVLEYGGRELSGFPSSIGSFTTCVTSHVIIITFSDLSSVCLSVCSSVSCWGSGRRSSRQLLSK